MSLLLIKSSRSLVFRSLLSQLHRFPLPLFILMFVLSTENLVIFSQVCRHIGMLPSMYVFHTAKYLIVSDHADHCSGSDQFSGLADILKSLIWSRLDREVGNLPSIWFPAILKSSIFSRTSRVVCSVHCILLSFKDKFSNHVISLKFSGRSPDRLFDGN